MRVLFLDDDVGRHHQIDTWSANTDAEIHHVYDAHGAIAAVRAGGWDLVSLDHDLGGQQMVESGDGTGFEVAVAMSRLPRNLHPARVVCHSWNPVGAERMRAVLADSGFNVVVARHGYWRL